MPLIGRHVSHTHANLPISLWSTISLTFALSYLQIIYAISFIARPFWSSNLDFPPFRQTIESAETFAINIILEIVPTSKYRSPAPTNFINDFTSRRHPLSLNRSNPMIGTSPHVATNASVHIIPPQMPQCYPEPRISISHPSPQQKEVQTETMRSTHTERFDKIGDSGDSIYGTAKKVTTSTRPKLSTTLEAHRQHQATSQATQSEPVTGAHKTTTVTKQEEHEEKQLTVHTVEFSQPADQALGISQPAAPVIDMSNPPMPMDMSPTDSFDGPGELEPELEPEVDPQSASSSRYTDNTSSLSLDAGHAAKSHSTESYPGKFPASDGMEYSNLATAEYAFRERGTTSVRPFSDY
jgi:hypothetical protein